MQQHGACAQERVRTGPQRFEQPVVCRAQVASQPGDKGKQHQAMIKQVASSLLVASFGLHFFLQRGIVQARLQARFAEDVEQALRTQNGMVTLQWRVGIGQGGRGQKIRAGQLVVGMQPVIA